MEPHVALRPHHDGSPLYVSDAHPELGSSIRVRVRVPREWGPARLVRTRSNPNHEPRFTDAEVVADDAGAVWWEADLNVENPVHGYRFLIEHEDGTTWWLSARGLSRTETRDVDDFRVVSYPAPPTWGAGTVLYQIFPDRFARSAAADTREAPDWAEPAAWTDPVVHEGPSTPLQFFGGDLDGITEHLDHVERIGATCVYLTPVFPARSNHRYDAQSFEAVDPLLGGDEALIRLVEAAHDRGLHLIGDLTSNHSGDAHEWFQAAHGHPEAPESAFYYWLDEEHLGYVSWLGVPSLPKFNWASDELRRRFIEGGDSVVAKWLKPPFSLDGWRIDVANMTGRYLDDDFNQEVRRTIRRTMVEIDPQTLLLAESTNDAALDFTGDAWHGAMTYANFTRPLWNWLRTPGSSAAGGINVTLGRTEDWTGDEFYEQHRKFTAELSWTVRLHTMNALDTHDTPRFVTDARPGSVPVAFGLAVTLPGIPVVFAGDEFGLTGLDGEHSRTPIPWDRVDEPEIAERIDLYASLTRLRREHPALSGGSVRWVHVSADALAFVRESVEECVLVLAARDAVDVALPDGSVGAPVRRLFGDASFDDGRLRSDGIGFAAWLLPGATELAWGPVSDDPAEQAGFGDVTPELQPEAFTEILEELEELRES
jgi:alpha-glucosidase